MMSPKENYLTMLKGGKPEYMPCMYTDYVVTGGARESFENGPAEGGRDGFGVLWHPTNSANGAPVPAPNDFVLEDIEDWEDVVKFPDLDAYDWEEAAREHLAGVDTERVAVEYQSWNSQFLRVTHLMGFQEGLCAFATDPEATYALMDKITDYKIRCLEYAAKYFKPDVFVNFDDVATVSSLFLSHDCYRKLIKPLHKKMNDAAKALGMIPAQHCCGKAESLVQDFIDEGSVAWQCAQPCNDLASVIEKYGDQIVVMGGYDTQGPASQPGATHEQITAEITRCFDEYGKYGKGYIFLGLIVGDKDDAGTQEASRFLVEEAIRQTKEYKY
ncbi:MAG: uroporphyrinogen decarboxylase family protein [Lachnospiraceae bacterium]|nr:uroporphyrinogen decarboxylase family protein [Lachnospiraceae bacterium]